MVSDRLRELGTVLSDPTRCDTLKFVLESPTPVSVATVAAKFGLHPNAARHHLSKLESVGLIGSTVERNPRGGRPAKLYCPGKERVEIQFPQRQYDLLSVLLLRALEKGRSRPELLEVVDEIGVGFGREFALRNGDLSTIQSPPDENQIGKCLARLSELGCRLQVSGSSEGTILVEESNCIFLEIAERNPDLVCRMHWAMIRGMLTWYWPDVEFETDCGMTRGEHVCRGTIRLPVQVQA